MTPASDSPQRLAGRLPARCAVLGDTWPVFAVGVRVSGGLLFFELGDEIGAAPLQVGGQLPQLIVAGDGRAVVLAVGGDGVLFELGAKQIVAGWPEDPLGEECVDQLHQNVLA